tara:strand:- start:2516 stop:3403 length:888 start_codon:yes stop_codon:yes gene_type:complete
MNNSPLNLKGTGVAVVTPFQRDLSVDYGSIEKIVNYLIDGGVNYIVVQGTTGESSTLTEYEKNKSREKFLDAVQGRLPLVLGLGGNDTNYLVKKIINSDLNGFSAILSVTPFYNKPTQEGLFQHYVKISDCSELPIILYNVPGRTSCNLEPETTIRLANYSENIIGIKEANSDILQIKKLIDNKPENFLIISGDDETAPETVLKGGDGVISVAANAIPREFSKMITFSLENKQKKAYDMLNNLKPLLRLLFEEGNPTGIKAAMNVLNLCENNLRLPLLPATKKLYTNIEKIISRI